MLRFLSNLKEGVSSQKLYELATKPRHEIEYALAMLMHEDKIDYLAVQNAYVQQLKHSKEALIELNVEAETCVVESLMYDKINLKDAIAENSVQRRLHLLNTTRRFNMETLNQRFNYDAERAKEISHLTT